MSYISYIDMHVDYYVPRADGSFSLETVPEDMREQLENDIEDLHRFEYGDVVGGYSGEVNYDYYVEELKTLSAKYPNILFSLSRSGEETGDLSEEYFLGGGYQCCPAIIRYEDFDPHKLAGGEAPRHKPEAEIDVRDFV